VTSSLRTAWSALFCHWRGVVTACAVAFALALLVQMGTWAALVFTDAARTRLGSGEAGTTSSRTPVVVEHEDDGPVPSRRRRSRPPRRDAAAAERDAMPDPVAAETAGSGAGGPAARPRDRLSRTRRPGPPIVTEDVNLVLTATGVRLRLLHDTARAIGWATAILLVFEVLAAASALSRFEAPEMRRMAAARTATIFLVLLIVPWHHVAPGIPYEGLFTTWEGVLEATHAFAPSADPEATDDVTSMLHLARFAFLPGAVLLLTASIALGVRAGLEDVVLPTGLSAEERALAEEAARRELTSNMHAGRAGRALADVERSTESAGGEGSRGACVAPAAPPDPPVRPLSAGAAAPEPTAPLRRPI